MSEHFCISITFLDGRFHGRGDGGKPEWPPSPLRLFQALVAANGNEINDGGKIDAALRWLERQPPPTIIAPHSEAGTPFCLSVPNNAMDIVGKAWSKGNYFGTGDANPATHRTMKTIQPTKLIKDNTVRYLWKLSETESASNEVIEALIYASGRLSALGWGVDMAVGNADICGEEEMEKLPGRRWEPTKADGIPLRLPREGTLDNLTNRHQAFLERVSLTGETGFKPVPPLTMYQTVRYRCLGDPLSRPHIIFELRDDDGSFRPYPQHKLMHIAGMLRCLAIQVMEASPPRGIKDPSDWLNTYVRGKAPEGVETHRRFSYLPLPSIGHRNADQIVRRVMITAPIGDDHLLEHLARRLNGRQLKEEYGNEFCGQGRPTLVRAPSGDTVAKQYTRSSSEWNSVTPVILPGHDDHKPAKRHKLILKALKQSGIEQSCTFEPSAISSFPKSHSAHTRDRRDNAIGYYRPKHLQKFTTVHLRLKFNDGVQVPGPITIGAGRHVGLGLFANPLSH